MVGISFCRCPRYVWLCSRQKGWEEAGRPYLIKVQIELANSSITQCLLYSPWPFEHRGA